jgi:hypothetical protein
VEGVDDHSDLGAAGRSSVAFQSVLVLSTVVGSSYSYGRTENPTSDELLSLEEGVFSDFTDLGAGTPSPVCCCARPFFCLTCTSVRCREGIRIVA